MRVACLGRGRLGRSMEVLLGRAGVEVRGWSRGERLPDADVYWIVVADSAIAEVAQSVPPACIALHASGALGPEALGDRVERGVLHPLMTFPGPEHGIPEVTGVGARVAGTPGAVGFARRIADALGMQPFEITGDVRRYHAAASMASGHLGALFLTAARVLSAAGIDEDRARTLLLPLAVESLRRAAAHGPAALTGPASRGDFGTEDAHRAVLAEADRPLYDALAAAVRSVVARDER